ncbi:MAG: type VI secretion system-associated protein TagF [Sedimentitalea sp.]
MQGFGAFGKMPSVGDFFRIQPPSGFVQVWDDWLQSALMTGQSVLGAAWDSHYMSAPIWRFTLSAGLAGPHKVIGVLMPSVDRVGRRFPLTLMSSLSTPGPAARDHLQETELFLQLENAALDALEDTMTRDMLQSNLAALTINTDPPGPPLQQAGRSLVLTGAQNTIELASGLLTARIAAPSLWSCIVHDIPRMLICDGLPAGPDVQGLFDLKAPVWSEARPV